MHTYALIFSLCLSPVQRITYHLRAQRMFDLRFSNSLVLEKKEVVLNAVKIVQKHYTVCSYNKSLSMIKHFQTGRDFHLNVVCPDE